MSLEGAVKRSGWVPTKAVGYITMAIAFLTSFLVISPFGDSLASNAIIDALVTKIGLIVPAVDVIANKTAYPGIARLAVASQWVFFPVYLACMVITQPPWVPLHWKEGISEGARRKALISSVIMFLVMGVYAYGDFWHGPLSIFGGTLFDPNVSAWWLRMPFTGRTGLALSAFLMPLFESTMYWFLMLLAGTSIAWLAGLGRKQSRRQPAD